MIPLSYSQKNILAGALQAENPADYLIAKTYFLSDEIPVNRILSALQRVCSEHPILQCALTRSEQASRVTERSNFGLHRIFTSSDVIVDATGTETPSTLDAQWCSGLMNAPLARWTLARWPAIMESGQIAQENISTSENKAPFADANRGTTLTLEAHHLLLDGGAISLLEESLAHQLHLSTMGYSNRQGENGNRGEYKLSAAHDWEIDQCDAARHKHLSSIRSLLEQVPAGAFEDSSTSPDCSIPIARRGVCVHRSSIKNEDYRAITELMARENLAIDSVVTAAAVALTAVDHQTNGVHVFHTIDPRFASSQLNVATCLVNTSWFPLQFPAFASAADLARYCDRGLASARRRRWLREEEMRRELVRSGQGAAVSVTLNVQRGRVHGNLREFLFMDPVVTAMGPVEAPTLVVIDDVERQRVDIELWVPEVASAKVVADRDLCSRMVKYLYDSARFPNRPAAELVGDWHPLEGGVTPAKNYSHWMEIPGFDRPHLLKQRPGVQEWLNRFEVFAVPAGAIVVFEGAVSEEYIDLVLAVHLHGCGYSPCRSATELEERVAALREEGEVVVWVKLCQRSEPLIVVAGDVNRTEVQSADLDLKARTENDREQGDHIVSQKLDSADLSSDCSTAYILPTSGTTGSPKLVRITHANLATFLFGARERYGWGSDDVVAQCAELTSDISVEEIFLSALVGANIVHLGSSVLRDPVELLEVSKRCGITVVDLPTSTWHALAADRSLIEQCRESGITNIVVGGEPIRPTAVASWKNVPGSVPVLSTYGPTEATVVATAISLCGEPNVTEHPGECDRLVHSKALGQPLIAGTVVVAFGEVILLGEAISPGYLGRTEEDFGVVRNSAGQFVSALATGDRVAWNRHAGMWLFAGRRDDVVKVAGRRVDLFALRQMVEQIPGVKDCYVGLIEGRVIVWARAVLDSAVDHARREVIAAGYPVSAVVRVDRIPRNSRGIVDNEFLVKHLDTLNVDEKYPDGVHPSEQAIRLAQAWSIELHQPIGPDDSLVDLAVSSLDMMKLLPITRALAGWNCSVRDIVQKPTARELTSRMQRNNHASIGDKTFKRSLFYTASNDTHLSDNSAFKPGILLLGATGSVGSAVLQEWLDNPSGHLVIPLRGAVPASAIWSMALEYERIYIVSDLGDWANSQSYIPEIMERYQVDVVLNCVGVTSTTAARSDLDAGNVELPLWLAQLCKSRQAQLIHLSSTVVAERFQCAEVTETGQAHFDYAESKIAGERVLVSKPDATVVRLPRVVPTEKGAQLDALLTIMTACRSVGSYPAVDVVEEVVTVDQVAKALMEEVRRTTKDSTSATARCNRNNGASLVVYRGKKVDYANLLPLVAPKEYPLRRWQNLIHEWRSELLDSRVVGLIDEWVKLVLAFQHRPWSTVSAVALPYVHVEQRDIGTSLTDADLIALL